MNNQKSLSIIIPIYNEQENIPIVYTQVVGVLQSLDPLYSYELIFVNDGSIDSSWSILTKLAHADAQVAALNLSRNFGHQAALTAGYAHATGDAVITMDADLQDPPSVLPALIRAWEQGAQIVYARRKDRKDTILKRLTAYLYYRLLGVVAEVPMPRNVADFRLMDKKAVDVLNEMPERARCLRGMVSWIGFSHAFVEFDRPNRVAGVTGYTWKKMFKLGFDGLTSFSMMPLRVALWMGMLLMSIGGSGMVYGMMHQWYGTPFDFIHWCAVGISFVLGMQFMCVWILGEYVGRAYDQQKERPLFIVAQKINTGMNTIANITRSKSNYREMQ